MQVLLAETHRSANQLAHKLLHIYDMRYNIIELKIMIENVRDTIYYIAVVTTRQKKWWTHYFIAHNLLYDKL